MLAKNSRIPLRKGKIPSIMAFGGAMLILGWSGIPFPYEMLMLIPGAMALYGIGVQGRIEKEAKERNESKA